MTHEHYYFSLEEMWSASLGRRLALDLTREVENFAGEKGPIAPEMRKFLAIKGYRDLLKRLERARDGSTAFAALRSVANEIRRFALDRPALWAAASRTPISDCSEWRTAYTEICDFILSILEECGIDGRDGEDALYMLRSLVRGFAIHQILGSFLQAHSYDESFDRAIDVFIGGLQALKAPLTSQGHASQGVHES